MRYSIRPSWLMIIIWGVVLCGAAWSDVQAETIKLLFLGDNGHHQPARRFQQFQPVMAARGIELKYTDRVGDLNDEVLREFDGLVLYANIDSIEPEQAKSLLEFVARGKGFVPLHCASFCFRNNDEVVALMGGQFQRHGTGVFRTTLTEAAATHPVTQGYRGFESWDETYVHTRHNEKDRIVLEYREDGEGREPWTWIRTHGEGRVFYTAWGHDERTWSHPGFQNLVERGIRWAVGQDPAIVPTYADRPEMTQLPTDVKPFEYVEAKMPFYPAGERWGTQGEPITKMQKPLPPEESVKHFVTPVGFEVRLFASEPDLGGKPLAMNWDERGRLWICESIDYPNDLQPEGKGNDRIRICEDTDGDGRADKFTVFAEGLSIPAAIAFYRGGAVVQDGTQTVYLKDTDGDDRADLRKVLVTGWAMNDTHGGVSNFHFAVDNWYYAMQGYNNSTPVLTDGEKVTSFRQGFFRFRIEGEGEKTAVTELEFLRSTNNNTWGLGFSDEGLVFGSTANGNPSEHMPIANRYYEQVRGWSAGVLNGIAESNKFDPITEQVRQVDHHGGFTAAAGHALYTARAWPREYWNRTAFVCEPTGHLIATFVLSKDGAGFHSKNSWNILASNDEWSAPIMAEVGPDGQLWVVDWYNIIVQHNPTPAGYRTGKGNAYEINLRDKSHARIYRVVWKGGADKKPFQLDLDQPSALAEALKSDNRFWRIQAQRLLVERGAKDVVPQLGELIQDRSVDELGFNAGATHAVWALKAVAASPDGGGVDSWVKEAIKHPSASVRRNAVLAFPEVISAGGEGLFDDADVHVRLAALLGASDLRSNGDEAGKRVARMLFDARVIDDPILADAAAAAATRHAAVVLREVLAVEANQLPPTTAEIVARVAEHVARGNDEELLAEIVIAWKNGRPAAVEATLAGFARGWSQERSISLGGEAEQVLLDLMPKLSLEGRGQLAGLAERWNLKSLEKYAREIVDVFLEQIRDGARGDTERARAARQLVEFRRNDSEIANQILQLIDARTSPELAAGWIEAVGRSRSPKIGELLVEQLAIYTPTSRAAAIRALLSRAEWASALVEGLENGKAQLSDLTLDQKQALTMHPDARIARRSRKMLSQGGGLPNADRQKVIDEISPVALKKGDAEKGKLVFVQQCAKCHRHSAAPATSSLEGSVAASADPSAEATKADTGSVGPDLSGMAVHPKHELLIHVLDPSRSVEGNFRVYTVTTVEGRVLTGLLSSESKTAIELIDAEAKRHAIQREEIDELIASRKSLMPEGFEKQVPPESIADVLEFLTQRGKYLPLPLDKAANVVTTKGMFFSEAATAERLIFRDWSPKTFEGVPFQLIDPRGERVPNAVMLYGPQGAFPPRMPKSVSIPCNAPVKALHMLSGVSGWGFPIGTKGSVSMLVRFKYADGRTEDHPLLNGIHFADYIRRVDVPESKFAFGLRGQQIRYLTVRPKRDMDVATIELIKGEDDTAPVVMALTAETGGGT